MPSDVARGRELIIGTYTEPMPHVDGKAEGILSCRFDGAHIGPPHLLALARNPTYLALSTDRRHLYAVHETTTFNGRPGGGVSAFARQLQSGELEPLNSMPSG